MTDPLPPDPQAALQAAFQNAKRPAPFKTDKECVTVLEPQIRQKRAAGWTYAQIHAELVRLGGYQGTYQTFYKYAYALLGPSEDRARR